MPVRLPKSIFRGFLKALRAGKAAGKKPIRKTRKPIPTSFAKGISDRAKRKAWSGYREQAIKERSGPTSFLLWIPGAIVNKATGKPGLFQKKMWKHVNAPALVMDTAAGNLLAKIPKVGKGLFKVEEQVPWGKGFHKDITRSSALAPLVKARHIAEPIIIGVGLEKGLTKLVGTGKNMRDEKRSGNIQPAFSKTASGIDDLELREKVASAMLRLHDECEGHKKRAHAVELIYKQADMGIEELPQTYGELEEKIASLITQDLVVLEKALELNGAHIKLGELEPDEFDPYSRNAEEEFQAAMFED